MDLRELCADLVAEEGRGHTPFGLYLINGSDDRAEIGRAVEREVFYDYFGNSPTLLAEEYDRYDRSSLFICMIDHTRNLPAGVFRLILPSERGFKSFHDLEKDWGVTGEQILRRADIDPESSLIWDLATLAISRDYRGQSASGLVHLGMLQGLSMLGTRCGISHLVAIIDLVVADLFQATFHRPLVAFPQVAPKHYLGSGSSLPMYLDAEEYRSRLALIDADSYELLFMGAGLEPMVSSPMPHPDSEVQEHWFRTA